MRRFFWPFAVGALALAGCSQQGPDQDRASQTFNVEEAPAAEGMSVPDIAPSAAPGVAFSYRYAFVLADEKIAAAQERHASACEALGVARCRISGLRYTLLDEDRVAASLDFRLAPDIARKFGKDGIKAITDAGGTLVDAHIEGEDVGTGISDSQGRSVDLNGELRRIEERLAAGGIGGDERTELQRQAEQLRAALRGERDTRRTGEIRLANTPMTFTYTGDSDFRFGSDPIDDAVDTAWNSFGTMVSFILIVVAVLLPWALLVGLGIAIWRSRWVRSLRRREAASPTDDTETAGA